MKVTVCNRITPRAIYLFIIAGFVCMVFLWAQMCAMGHLWRSEDNFVEVVPLSQLTCAPGIKLRSLGVYKCHNTEAVF